MTLPVDLLCQKFFGGEESFCSHCGFRKVIKMVYLNFYYLLSLRNLNYFEASTSFHDTGELLFSFVLKVMTDLPGTNMVKM